MDVKNTTTNAKTFQEQKIELTFKSQTEVDVFYGLFNHSLVGNFLRENAYGDIAGDIRSALGNTRSVDEMKYYREFDERLHVWVLSRNAIIEEVI